MSSGKEKNISTANPSTATRSPSPLQQSRHCQRQARPARANPSDSSTALPELFEAESPVRFRGGKQVKLEQATRCEIFGWYKVCVWARYTGVGWFCSMPVCWKEFKI